MRQSLVNLAVLTAVSCLLSCLAYPGHGQEVPAGPAQSLLEEASEQLGYGEYQAAEAACREAISSYPEYEFEARLVLAEVYYGQGRFDEAIQQAELVLAKVSRLYPDDSQLIAKGEGEIKRLREAQRIFSECVAQLKATIASGPGSAAVAARLKLGDALLINGRRQQAIAEYEKIIDELPTIAAATQAARRLALIYQMQSEQEKAERERRFEEEVAQIKRMIASGGGTAKTVANKLKLGNTFLKYASRQRAVAVYQKLIDDYPATAGAAEATELGLTQRVTNSPARCPPP